MWFIFNPNGCKHCLIRFNKACLDTFFLQTVLADASKIISEQQFIGNKEMLTAQYIKDHLKFIENLKPEFGQAIAKIILEKSIYQLGDREAVTIEMPLMVVIREMKPLQCLDIEVEGIHVGHIGF